MQSIEQDIDYQEGEEGFSARNSSGPDELVFDDTINMTGQSSPRTSNHSNDEISELPFESRGGSCGPEQTQSSAYIPIETRSPFRNPSSVRAMQLENTPPPFIMSPSSQHRYKLNDCSRNSTPRSARSYRSAVRSPSKLSPTKRIKKEYPLVLLHVTVLPIALPWSQETLESVLPGYWIKNWNLLRERVTATVLERGILVPHPREDYDLLEERLLESLELQIPRILKCGHFHLNLDEEYDRDASETEEYDSDNDLDKCGDCGKRIRDGLRGSGTGQRRWDIKIYAANGLMRAGAWGAAWSEMERVDVEILPWIEDDLRRELDLRSEEEEHQVSPTDYSQSAGGNFDGASRMDDVRMREIYGQDAQAYVDGLREENPECKSNTSLPTNVCPSRSAQDIPLWTLLKNYMYLASQDRKNIIIFLLSTVVLSLTLGSRPTTAASPLLQSAPITTPVAIASAQDLGAMESAEISSSILSALSPEPTLSVSPLTDSHGDDLMELITGDLS
ncbi:MAG: hypothetical protein Q9187_002287 [Circinaria calcarea]